MPLSSRQAASIGRSSPTNKTTTHTVDNFSNNFPPMNIAISKPKTAASKGTISTRPFICD